MGQRTEKSGRAAGERPPHSLPVAIFMLHHPRSFHRKNQAESCPAVLILRMGKAIGLSSALDISHSGGSDCASPDIFTAVDALPFAPSLLAEIW